MLWQEVSPQTASIVTPASPGRFLSALLLFALQAALVIRLLTGLLSAFGPSHGLSGGRVDDVQMFDTLHLLCRRLGGHSIMARLSDGLVQTLIAALGVVALFSTVVGLDYYSARLCSQVAGTSDVAM